jgi:hypothetical protein
VVIVLAALLATALVTVVTRPLLGAASALVRGLLRAPRPRSGDPQALLVVPGPRATRGRACGRVPADRAPPAFG